MGFPNGDIKLSNNFELNAALPLDARTTVATLVNRDAIDFKYVGLTVFVTATSLLYVCTNIVGAGVWITVGASSTPISLTTTSNSGVATFNSSTGVLNIPNYTSTVNVLEYSIIGDNTTTEFTFTHNLNNKYVATNITEAFGPNYEEVFPRKFNLTNNTVKLVFQTAPSIGNNYNVVVIGNLKSTIPGGTGIGSAVIGSTFIIG